VGLEISRAFSDTPITERLGGRPASYLDSSILLMAIVQTIWCKTYEAIIDEVASHPTLAQAIGFSNARFLKASTGNGGQAAWGFAFPALLPCSGGPTHPAGGNHRRATDH